MSEHCGFRFSSGGFCHVRQDHPAHNGEWRVKDEEHDYVPEPCSYTPRPVRCDRCGELQPEAASIPATAPLDVAEVIDALDAQAKLLVCYRIGKRPSGSLLDRVKKANELRSRLAEEEQT